MDILHAEGKYPRNVSNRRLGFVYSWDSPWEKSESNKALKDPELNYTRRTINKSSGVKSECNKF